MITLGKSMADKCTMKSMAKILTEKEAQRQLNNELFHIDPSNEDAHFLAPPEHLEPNTDLARIQDIQDHSNDDIDDYIDTANTIIMD